MFQKLIRVAAVRQGTSADCGPACAAMIFSSVDPRMRAPLQGPLYDYMVPYHTDDLITSPLGLVSALNAHGPRAAADDTFDYTFETSSLPAPAMASVVGALLASSRPAAAMVFTTRHWVLICGVQTDVEPAPGVTYAIEALWIVDPHYGEVEHVTYGDWVHTFFTGAPSTSVGGGTFVVVADSRRVPRTVVRIPGDRDLAYEPRSPLPQERAVACALAGLARYGLHAVARDGTPGTPTRVANRPDAPVGGPQGYYELPIRLPTVDPYGFGATWVLARVDLITGQYLGARFSAQPPSISRTFVARRKPRAERTD